MCTWPSVGLNAQSTRVVCGARELETHWFGIAPPFVITSPCAHHSGGRGRGSLGSTFSWCGRARMLADVEIVYMLGDRRRRRNPISLPISCPIIVSV